MNSSQVESNWVNNDRSKDRGAKEQIIECPNCSCPISGSGTGVVTCSCCGSQVDFSQRKPEGKEEYSQKIAGIKTVSAARAHMQFLFETYDWAEFSKNASLFTIPEMDALLENIKTEHGDDCDTWKMCFEYRAMCLKQKIENIDSNVDSLAVRFVNGGDLNACHNSFDMIKEGVKLLKEKEKSILDELNSYILYATRFGLEQKEVDKLEEERASLKKACDAIHLIESIEKHPKVAELLQRRKAEIEEEYAKKGIDAAATYEKALEQYEQGNHEQASDLFEQIFDYEESAKYLREIHQIHSFGQFKYMHNRVFYYDKHLMGMKDMLINEKFPLTEDFSRTFGFYGDKFYYFTQQNKVICYFSINDPLPKKPPRIFTARQIPLYGSVIADSLEFQSESHRYALFLLQYSSLDSKNKKRAFCKEQGIPYKKEYEKLCDSKNWYDLLQLDLKTGTLMLIAEGVQSMVENDTKQVYYIGYKFLYKKKSIDKIEGTALYSYNFENKQSNLEIEGNGCIEYIDPSSGKIVITRNDHGEHNKTILIKEGADGKERAIAQNVYDIYKVIGNKIFYTIGNKKVRSLCSIGLDGEGYVEVMKYIEKIVRSDDEWLYITRGDKEYVTLYRMSVNGGQAQKIAFGVSKWDVREDNFTIFEGYFYFTNFNNVLCRVRMDSTGFQELVRDVNLIIAIKGGKIFYLCIDERTSSGSICSLYVMNADGSNRQKLIYNVHRIGRVNDDKLLYLRDEEYDSLRELYGEITDPKLNKQIDKVFTKLQKKKRATDGMFDTVSLFDLNTFETERIAYLENYPDKKSLKLYKKEMLKK